jgi:hypothetical protein
VVGEEMLSCDVGAIKFGGRGQWAWRWRSSGSSGLLSTRIPVVVVTFSAQQMEIVIANDECLSYM